MPINVQLAGTRRQLPLSAYSVSVLTSGNHSGTGFTQSGTIDLYFQAQNRCGFNLQTDKTTVAYQSGDAISVTFNSSAIASGEEVFGLIVSGDTSGNRENAVQLARWNAREFDQVSKRSLPVEILLHHDNHLAIDTQVQTSDDLPSNDSLIAGAVYLVVDDAQAYIYNPDAPDGVYPAVGSLGYWLIHPFSRNTYVADSYNLGGTDTPLEIIDTQLAGLPKLPGNPSTPIRYWISNDFPESGGTSIQQGNRYQFEFTVSGLLNRNSIQSYNSLFSGVVEYKFLGLVRLATGVLYADVEGADSTYIWNPGIDEVFNLKSECYPGYAIALDIWFAASSDKLLYTGLIKPGQDIRLNDIYPISNQAIKSDLWYLTGDCILGEGLTVLPNKILPGQALVKGYRIPLDTITPLPSLAADTPGQIIAISAARNGDIVVRDNANELDSTEAQLAVVDTTPGICFPSEFSNTVNLNAGEKLNLTINLPLTTNFRAIVRGDYPEVSIANLEGDWNNPEIRVFLLKEATIYYQDDLISSGNLPQLYLEINTLTGKSEIPLIPQPTDDRFGLYGYGAIVLSSQVDPQSDLPAGEYKVAVQYVYTAPNTKITAISRDPLEGNLKEAGNLLDRTIDYWGHPIVSIREARALKGRDLVAGKTWLINGTKKYIPYVFDPSVTDADNGIGVIKPTILGTASGALVPARTLGTRIIGETGLLPARHNIRFQGDNISVADDPSNNASVVLLGNGSTTDAIELSKLLTFNSDELFSLNEEVLLEF